MNDKQKVKLLLEALKELTYYDGITVYSSEEDECGSCYFCQELSFKPHKEDCKFVKAKQAIIVCS